MKSPWDFSYTCKKDIDTYITYTDIQSTYCCDNRCWIRIRERGVTVRKYPILRRGYEGGGVILNPSGGPINLPSSPPLFLAGIQWGQERGRYWYRRGIIIFDYFCSYPYTVHIYHSFRYLWGPGCRNIVNNFNSHLCWYLTITSAHRFSVLSLLHSIYYYLLSVFLSSLLRVSLRYFFSSVSVSCVLVVCLCCVQCLLQC